MDVIEMSEFGGPEVLVATQRPDPTPGASELVVDVSFSEILFLDTQLRRGWGRDHFTLDLPTVLGVGVSGVVVDAGPGVDDAWVGRRVIARTGGSGSYPGGGYAERAVVPVAESVVVPDGLGLDVATAARGDGSLALSRLERARLESGDVAVVTAAGGSLGTWLLPLATAAGVRVVATARGEVKHTLLRRIGAAAVVDPTGLDDAALAARLRDAAGGAVTAVFDGTGGAVGTVAHGLLAPGGRFLGYGSASGEFARTDADAGRRIEVVGIDDQPGPEERRRHTAAALGLLASGRVEPVLGQVLPLGEAAAAHRAIEGRRVLGKSLLGVG